jgi:hypothetical protein
MALKLGRLPNDPHKPRLRLGSFLTATYPAAPDLVDYITGVPEWPVYGNDAIGDCTCAAAGHMIEAWTQYGQGSGIEVSKAAVIKAYSAVSGYDPNTGANDNGAVMQDVLDYWRKTGIGGHKILAFAQVDVSHASELAAALYLFGHVYLGFSFPSSAMDQFNQGQPWDVVKGSPIEGGHAVDWGLVAKGQNHRVITWGAVQEMTPAFFAKYVDEAWVVLDQEWINRTGVSPEGLDMKALNDAFTSMTGNPGPFPVSPVPPSPPEPPPFPSFFLWRWLSALWRWLSGGA